MTVSIKMLLHQPQGKCPLWYPQIYTRASWGFWQEVLIVLEYYASRIIIKCGGTPLSSTWSKNS